jgi:hypothetical protein
MKHAKAKSFMIVRIHKAGCIVMLCPEALRCRVPSNAVVAACVPECPAVPPEHILASPSSDLTPRLNAPATATRRSTTKREACRDCFVRLLDCNTRLQYGGGLGRGRDPVTCKLCPPWLTTAQLAIAQLPPPGPHLPAVPISTFAFDTTQELLWTGNNHVSTFTHGHCQVPSNLQLCRGASRPFTVLISNATLRTADMRLPMALSSNSSSPRRASFPSLNKASIIPIAAGSHNGI